MLMPLTCEYVMFPKHNKLLQIPCAFLYFSAFVYASFKTRNAYKT